MARAWPIEEVYNLIKRIYRQVLEQEYTPEKLIEYGSNLVRGERSVKEIIQELALSEEYEDRFIEPFPEEIRIIKCFNHLLARDPTQEELDFYREISVVEGVDDVIRQIMDSELYFPGDDGTAFEHQLITSCELIYLKSNNGQYVCAEYGGGRELVANRWKPLGWETFVIEKVNGEREAISDGELIWLRASSGQYVHFKQVDSEIVEIIASSWRRSDADTITIGKISEGGEIGDGELIWLRANNGQYICTSTNDQRLYAGDTEITEMAQFTINIQQLR
ncbi:MAG: phycobilisome rod-core linker polypeptide [Promethearchaeota archaeon]